MDAVKSIQPEKNDCKYLIETNGNDLFTLHYRHDHKCKVHRNPVVPTLERKTAPREASTSPSPV